MATLSIRKSWKNQSIATRIIRLWLGVTWVYGGWNKATDAGFLSAASPHYIGAQLAGYLGTSPIHGLLQKMIEHATLIGWAVMISEFAIGFATLAGIALELAALGGFAMSIALFLSATWSVKPYFLGSDSAYAILWLALFFLVRQNYKGGRGITTLLPNFSDRREIFRFASVGIVAIGAALVGGRVRHKNSTPETGTVIATLAELPIGGVKNFAAADGSPALLFRSRAGVFAYSRICPHQGCSVNYDAGKNALICPCHNSAFDPTKGAAVITGPAVSPLATIKVAIRGNSIVQI